MIYAKVKKKYNYLSITRQQQSRRIHFQHFFQQNVSKKLKILFYWNGNENVLLDQFKHIYFQNNRYWMYNIGCRFGGFLPAFGKKMNQFSQISRKLKEKYW